MTSGETRAGEDDRFLLVFKEEEVRGDFLAVLNFNFSDC